MDYTTLRAANEARQKEWDTSDQIDLSYRGNELAGEIGEAFEAAMAVLAMGAAVGRACNIIKKLERERMDIRGSRATVDQLMDELADGEICLDLLAMKVGRDLRDAVVRKFNETSEKNNLKTRMV